MRDCPGPVLCERCGTDRRREIGPCHHCRARSGSGQACLLRAGLLDERKRATFRWHSKLSCLFSSGGYLELITPYDGSLPDGRRIAENLKKGEGPVAAGLEITSAEQSARDLTAAGVKTKDPIPGPFMRPGEKEPPPTRRWSILFADELASRPLFLIQYIRATPRRAGPPPNPNSAFALATLMIAGNDPEQAAAGYGNIGKVKDQEIPLPEFGAAGKEIVLERGSILLLRATDLAGPTARRLKERGEGILAVRMTATDLNQARKQVGEKNVSKEDQSVLVAPENAAGVWLEFQIPRP